MSEDKVVQLSVLEKILNESPNLLEGQKKVLQRLIAAAAEPRDDPLKPGERIVSNEVLLDRMIKAMEEFLRRHLDVFFITITELAMMEEVARDILREPFPELTTAKGKENGA